MVGLFKSAQEFESMMGGFFEYLTHQASLRENLLISNLIIRFTCTDPDVVLVVDCSGNEIEIRSGDTTTDATIGLSMSADTAHRFWLGKVNLVAAVSRRKIKTKGPTAKILEMLPVIKPALDLYPQYLRDNGYAQYLNV